MVHFFRGAIVDSINLAGLEHVIVCTSSTDTIFFRVYRTQLKKSGSKTPHVELVEMGPSCDFKMGRSELASADMVKKSIMIPRVIKPQKKKNISNDVIAVRGQMHMGKKQDLSELQTRKKGVRAFDKPPKNTKSPKKNKSADDNMEQ